jgi:hypothetical protein
MPNNDQARVRAEAMFRRKEEQKTEAAQAWAEYQAQPRAIAERTKRLKALRLAKEAARPSTLAGPEQAAKTQRLQRKNQTEKNAHA